MEFPRGVQDPGVGRGARGARHHHLHTAAAIQVGHQQPAVFTPGAGRRPGPFRGAVQVVSRDDRAALGDDDIRLGVVVDIRQDDPRPGAVRCPAGAPLQCAGLAVQRDQRIGRSDDFGLRVAIDVDHRRRGIPAGLAPGTVAPAALPFKRRAACWTGNEWEIGIPRTALAADRGTRREGEDTQADEEKGKPAFHEKNITRRLSRAWEEIPK